VESNSLQRAKARLQADRNALEAVRLHFNQLHLNLQMHADIDTSNSINMTPKLSALNPSQSLQTVQQLPA
jgi:autotransporter translocation and assembly factor TamB